MRHIKNVVFLANPAIPGELKVHHLFQQVANMKLEETAGKQSELK